MTKKHWRLRKLSRPGLQFRLIGTFTGMAAMALLLQFLLLGGKLTKMLAALPNRGGDVADQVPGVLVSVLALSAIIVLPVMFALGVLITHKIAGPVYRFEEYLGQIARGEAVGPCRIRKGDELQELCTRLNSAIATLRRTQDMGQSEYMSVEGLTVDGSDEPEGLLSKSSDEGPEELATVDDQSKSA